MNQNVNLDLIPKFAVFGNLYFSQYDVGREATINLLNGAEAYTIPVGATVKIQATKPSGLGFNESCTFSGNVVTVVSTETMTDEAGRIPCELRIEYNGDVLGTANFIFNVERSPHPEGTTDGTAESVLNDISVAFNYAMEQIENSGGLTPSIKNALLDCFAHVAWIDEHGQDYYDALADELFAVTGITLNSSTLLFSSLGSTQQLIASLIPSTSTATVSWASSDTSVATVSSSGLVTSVANGSATITASVGSVSATCSVSVAVATVTSISAVLNASGHTFYVGDPVDDIKPYLTVTATYSDSSTTTVPSGSYTLSGTLSQVGANTITVSYESVTTTVSVTCAAAELSYISAVYTQSGTVYTTDTLDSLKADLVVTAHYSDSTTSTVASTDYTLSGTLTEGTSTITVSYEGKTTTFSVTVSVGKPRWFHGWNNNFSNNTDPGTFTYYGYDNSDNNNMGKRRILYCADGGEHPVTYDINQYATTTPPYDPYLIEIPSSATGIKVTRTSGTTDYYASVTACQYTNSDWYRTESSGFTQVGSSMTYTFTSASSTHVFVNTRIGSAGTTFMGEADPNLSVEFVY